MERQKTLINGILLVALSGALLLTGCGGGSGGSNPAGATNTTPTTANSGVAVDPYIEGAQFFIDVNDNGIFDAGEPESTVTGSDGVFTFSTAATSGQKILSKPGALGTHLGKPFKFQMASTVDYVDATGKVIVSPMTSLVSQGLDINTFLSTVNTQFQAAGINVTFTAADLKADPLEGLDAKNASDLTDDDLQRIRAVIAIQQYIATIQKLADPAATTFSYSISNADFTKAENIAVLNALAQIVKYACNVDFIRTTSTEIAAGVKTAVAAANTAMAASGVTLSSEHEAKINNILQVKAVDVAKTSVSIAEYCSAKLVARISGGSAVDAAFVKTLTDETSNALVKKIGPRYYFQRLKPALDNAAPPSAITGLTPGGVNVDEQVWAGIKTAVKLNDGTANIDKDFAAGAWSGFKGIDIDATTGNLSPLK